jgi:hypothetical protein
MKAALPCFQHGLPVQPVMGQPDVAQCAHSLRTTGQQVTPGSVHKWAPEIQPVTVYSIFDFFFLVNNSRKLFKVLKSMEILEVSKTFKIMFFGILKSRPTQKT